MLNRLRTLANSHDPNHMITDRQIVAVNALLSHYVTDRGERLELLSAWFERPIHTSKELSKGEAGAIIELGYVDNETWEHNLEFTNFVHATLEELYRF